jgi:GT2 family glycosyltransferase
MRHTLSIAIPSRDRPDLLRACLASIRRHASERPEVVVVDDGSANAIASEVAAEFGCRVIRHEAARGFCVAANRGVEAATGSVVQLLNDDTEVCAGWDAAVTHFDGPHIGAVSPLVLRATDPTRIDSAGDGYFVGGVAYKRHSGSLLAATDLRAERIFGANGTASFFRREAFLSVGGLPEEFGAYFDDIDLSFRLRRAGFAIMFEPASRVLHHVSSSYGPPRGDLLARQSRNEEMVFWRNLAPRDLLFALPLHAAVLTAKAARRLREGSLGPFLRGRLAALMQTRAIVRHRRKIILSADCADYTDKTRTNSILSCILICVICAICG